MAIPIEAFTVVVRRSRIQTLLDQDRLRIPNDTALVDDELWRCCFMDPEDAQEFRRTLESLGLNISTGPDPDVVLVDEWDRSVDPYCEWLVVAPYEKAVLAWLAGTRPDEIVAPEGWNPKAGSGVQHGRNPEELELLRLEGNVEVWRDNKTGKEVYRGRTSTPVEALFAIAKRTIQKHFVSPGEPPATGAEAEEVSKALEMLERVAAEVPEQWNVHWLLGKGRMILGQNDSAYEALRRAAELERTVEAIPRELAGICLVLGRLDEAVQVAEGATALHPDNAETIGNLAIAYLMAGRLDEARKSVDAALRIDAADEVNRLIERTLTEVAEGFRPPPRTLADLTTPLAKPKKRRLWKFWT